MIDDHGGHPQEELTLVQASALGGRATARASASGKGVGYWKPVWFADRLNISSRTSCFSLAKLSS